ncbi:hypothetical protein C6496_17200 [Candidatus Poribacteria bacterium]|nr:MAG: hypothetical protein C6496_17200 [Candidatus Poribacteria bacterium]
MNQFKIRGTAVRKLRTWRESLIERLTTDPRRASGYLQAALEDYQIHGEAAVFLLALQTVIESRGGISKLAKQTGIQPKSVSEALNRDVLPQIDLLVPILNTLGCRLSIQSWDSSNTNCEVSAEHSSTAPIESQTISDGARS